MPGNWPVNSGQSDDLYDYIYIVGYWGHKSLRQPQMVNHPHRLEIMSRRLQLSHLYTVHELLNALVKIGYPKMVTQESLVPWVKHILNSNRWVPVTESVGL